DHPGGDEAGDAGGEMDDVAARVVERPLLREVTAAPDQEGVDRVDEEGPEGDERDPGLEVEAAEDRAEHQDRRDRREDDLEIRQRRHREEEFFFRELADMRLFEQAVAIEDRPWLPDEVSEEP